jgi:hypothetical protein
VVCSGLCLMSRLRRMRWLRCAANARLRAVVEAKDTEIAALRTSHQAQLDALRAQVTALSAEVAELRARLGQKRGTPRSLPRRRAWSSRRPSRCGAGPGASRDGRRGSPVRPGDDR